MKCIRVLKDEDFGLESVEFNNPRIRYGARGIIIREDGKIAIFNKSNKNEYKLPGGGVDNGEDVKEAFIQQRELLEKSGRKCTVRIEGTDDVAEAFYTDFIFINKDGGPYHQGTLNKTIGRIVRDANVEAMDKEGLTMLPDFSNHCFRSTYITRCAEKKVPIAVTMKQVGHDDKKTTTGIYLTVHPDWMEQELSVMDNLFE